MSKYITIKQPIINEIIIEKSRFITYLTPVKTEEDARLFLESIRKKHYDATHNCYAYIIGNDKNIQKSSDDGEPSGTAGIPILEAIKNNNITDVICIVTRYFGGIKLGAGGLVRAYSKSASEAINVSELIEYIDGVILELTMDYQTLPKVDNYILTNNLIIQNKQYYHEAYLTIIVPKSNESTIKNDLINISNGKIEIKDKGESFFEAII